MLKRKTKKVNIFTTTEDRLVSVSVHGESIYTGSFSRSLCSFVEKSPNAIIISFTDFTQITMFSLLKPNSLFGLSINILFFFFFKQNKTKHLPLCVATCGVYPSALASTSKLETSIQRLLSTWQLRYTLPESTQHICSRSSHTLWMQISVLRSCSEEQGWMATGWISKQIYTLD